MEVTMSGRYLTKAVLRELVGQLTERDQAILHRVADLRFVTGDQLTRLHFANDPASARAARRALLRLTHLDCLARLPRQVGGVRRGSAGFVYHLGSAGQRLGVACGWLPARRWRPHVPGTLFVDHSLQVAELHTLLVEADRNGAVELLALHAEPACWRYSRASGRGFALKPDSYVELGAGDYVDSYFIEVDMGSEGSRALDEQLKRYVVYHDSGIEQRERGVFPKTLWLTPSPERTAAVESCIQRLPKASRELFAAAAFGDVLTTLSMGVTSTQSGG
jgi:hypothetical protein